MSPDMLKPHGKSEQDNQKTMSNCGSDLISGLSGIKGKVTI